MKTRKRGMRLLWLLLAIASPFLYTSLASAEYTTGRLSLTGEVSEKSTFFHDGGSELDWVQQRTELVVGGVYRLIEPLDNNGLIRKWEWALQWRGRYDAVYDIRDRYKRRGYDRNDFRFPEGNKPRELYTDLEFQGIPLSLRIGRQQVVWGEADFFRSLDVINPLRIDQMTLVGDDLDKYREPLWIAKGLLDLGNHKHVAGLVLEVLYSPDGTPLTDKLILGNGWRIYNDIDCFPDSIDCRRPHAIPWKRVRHPWEIERVGTEYGTAPDQGDLGPLCASLGIPEAAANCKADFIYLDQQKFADRQGLVDGGHPYREVHLDRSMAGARLMGQTVFQNIYFTLNYLWKRSEIPAPSIGWGTLFDPSIADDGNLNLRLDKAAETVANLASPDLNGDGVPDGNEAALRRCINESYPVLIVGPMASGGRSAYGYSFPSESLGAACVPIYLQYPYSHILGFTLTYNDFDWTGFIWRTEQSVSLKEPRTKYPALAGTRAGQFPAAHDFASGGGKETTQIWRSMVGFDYLASPFQAGQLPRSLYNIQLTRSLLTDQWFYTFQFFNEYWSNVSRQLGQDFSLTRRHDHWNPILTWIMTGFFMQSRLRPLIAIGYDINADFPVSWFQIQWFFSQKLMLRVGDVSYWGSSHAESFLFLNHYSDRDNVYARLTYFFL